MTALRACMAALAPALLVFLGVAAVFLVMEHTGHVLAALPYLLLLACPLMHFLHRGTEAAGIAGTAEP